MQHRTRWVAAASAAFIGVLAMSVPSAAADGSAYVLADVQCDADDNGVLDLTLVNEQPQSALFIVAAAESSATSAVQVAAGSVSAITFTDLDDGLVAVPVSVDGVESDVAVSVNCDQPEVAVMGAALRQSTAPPSLPSTGSASSSMLLLGASLVAAGAIASLVSRRRWS
jgi:LPXTG-motif cell wall-anchored protein